MGEGMLGFYAGEFERRGVRGSCELRLSFSLFSFLFFPFLVLSFFLACSAVGMFCRTGSDGIFSLTITPRVGKKHSMLVPHPRAKLQR